MHRRRDSLAQWFANCSRQTKRLISIVVDVMLVSFSLWLSFSLRLGELYQPPVEQVWLFVLAPVLAIPVFIRFGLYRAIIRYIGVDAVLTVLQAVILFSLLFAFFVLLAGEYAGMVPRTVHMINAVLIIILVGGSRLLARWLVHKYSLSSVLQVERYIPPVLIYGAGQAGVQVSAMLKLSRQMRPVAFIDDNAALWKHQVNGLTVYGFDEIPALIDKYHVTDLLLAMPSLLRYQRKHILNRLEPLSIHVRTLPDLMDIAHGRLSVSDIQEVDIGDLLGRDPVPPVSELLHANISDKVVMVTGAGGSIGSELCRQILQLQPEKLILFEVNEFNLYQIEKELEKQGNKTPVFAILGSVLNQLRLEKICRHFQVQTIYHAAAYKHVPLVEKNTIEGIENNVFGTLSTARAAVATGVETFVLISTDKAVRPGNTMGASKRLAELILQAFAQSAELARQTRFTMVRFGNVLGSSGSVVPLFREQIISGGPVTVTDPDIIRYFMTISEAAELVIQAGAMGQGGDVFVLDMGESVKILELAKRMIHLSGFTEKDGDTINGDIEIVFTGLRPGEKLYEELLIGDKVSRTVHEKIMRAEETVIAWNELSPALDELSAACAANNSSQSRQLLLNMIDGFKPQSEVNDWSSKKDKLTETA